MSRIRKASGESGTVRMRKELCQGTRPGDCYVRLVPRPLAFRERIAAGWRMVWNRFNWSAEKQSHHEHE